MTPKIPLSGLANSARVLMALLVACSAASVAAAGPAENYIDAQLRVARSLAENLDSIADAADAAAARLVAGGNLYLAGEPGMVSELAGRAGGLCGAKGLPGEKAAANLGRNDVVLFSDYGTAKQPAADTWKGLTQSNALVIAFASKDNPMLKPGLPANVRAIPVDVPCDSHLVSLPDGRRLFPAAPPAIAIAQWTFTAELIGACRRQNRQLAVYLSVYLDEGRQRLKRTAGLLFEPNLRPEPVARKQYAGQFLDAVRTSLEAVRREDVPSMRKAASWLAEARAAHAKIYRNFQGHLPPVEAGLPGDATFFTNVKPVRATDEEGVKWLRENLHSGDVYLFLGYQKNEDAMAAAANALGARTIFLTSAGPGPEQSKSPRHLYVNPHWPYTDACLELPGYDVKACPLSCILGLTCYYAMCGEVVGK